MIDRGPRGFQHGMARCNGRRRRKRVSRHPLPSANSNEAASLSRHPLPSANSNEAASLSPDRRQRRLHRNNA
ncbi:hypothetical protein PR003_g19414 [Phytophthora rubi]|nr:hypothetical protein PR003_g19414 [Phytophthora rubi]